MRMKNKEKKVAYKNLPRSHKLAIAHYMAIDGEAWKVEYEFEGGGSGYIKSQLKKVLPLFVKKYGSCKFGVDEVPADVLVEKIMKLEHIQKDFKSFMDYHKWYKKNCTIPRHKNSNRWPCIMDSTTDPIYNGVLEDGWHRFHRYIESEHKTIPCISYLPKEDYKYA
jgi:hypothetical protein